MVVLRTIAFSQIGFVLLSGSNPLTQNFILSQYICSKLTQLERSFFRLRPQGPVQRPESLQREAAPRRFLWLSLVMLFLDIFTGVSSLQPEAQW